MTEPNQLILKLKVKLENDPDVLAFVLVGSQARETIYKAGQFSDLEAFIVVKDEDTGRMEKKLPEIAGSLWEVLFSFKHQIGFVAVYDDLLRVELPVIKQSDMRSIFRRPKTQEVKILIDKTNGQLKEILNKRPNTINYKKLFRDIVVNFWYWQIIGVQYFKKGELYNTRAILNIHASALIKLFELLNNPEILLLETNKRVEEFLTQDQLSQLRSVTPSYNKYEIKKALEIAMIIFPNVFDQIENKYRYDYVKNIEKKIKPEILKLM